MLQATQLNCKFSNNAMQSLGHHRQIRRNQKSPRCRFGGDERWKQIWGFHKIATYFVAENAQKCVKGDRGSGNNLFCFFLVSNITNSFPSNIFDQKSIYWECLSSIMERMGYDFATICKTYARIGFEEFIQYFGHFWISDTFSLWKLGDQCLTTDHTYDASWEIIQAINVSIEAPLHWLASQSIVEDIQGKERWEIFLWARRPISGVQLSDTGCDQLLPKNYFPFSRFSTIIVRKLVWFWIS